MEFFRMIHQLNFRKVLIELIIRQYWYFFIPTVTEDVELTDFKEISYESDESETIGIYDYDSELDFYP